MPSAVLRETIDYRCEHAALELGTVHNVMAASCVHMVRICKFESTKMTTTTTITSFDDCRMSTSSCRIASLHRTPRSIRLHSRRRRQPTKCGGCGQNAFFAMQTAARPRLTFGRRLSSASFKRTILSRCPACRIITFFGHTKTRCFDSDEVRDERSIFRFVFRNARLLLQSMTCRPSLLTCFVRSAILRLSMQVPMM